MLILFLIYTASIVAFILFRHDQIAFEVWGDIMNKSHQYRFDLLKQSHLSPTEKSRLIQIENDAYELWVKKLWNIG